MTLDHYKNIHNKRKIISKVKIRENIWLKTDPWESWNINIQAIKGKQECWASQERWVCPLFSAALLYNENPTRHTQCVLLILWWLSLPPVILCPGTSLVQHSSAWHCMSCSAVCIGHPAWEARSWLQGSLCHRGGKRDGPPLRTLWQMPHWAHWPFRECKTHLEMKWHSSGHQKKGNKRSKAYICLW